MPSTLACAIEQNGDIYLGKYAGWYSVRQEAYFDEAETTVGSDGIRREPLGSPVEWAEEETYFFRAVSLSGQIARPLCERAVDFECCRASGSMKLRVLSEAA